MVRVSMKAGPFAIDQKASSVIRPASGAAEQGGYSAEPE